MKRSLAKRAACWLAVCIAMMVLYSYAFTVSAFALNKDSDAKQPMQVTTLQVDSAGTISHIQRLKSTNDGSAKVVERIEESQVVEDLPVRIITSYSSKASSGTHLSKIDGNDGTTRFDIDIQNITAKPQAISYDSNARNQSVTELVSLPLTAIASVRLKGVSPSSVVIADKGAGASPMSGVTNGVVSVDKEGNTIVQWAAVLAPPVLSGEAVFSLVLDGQDVKVPQFDVAIQPGFTGELTQASDSTSETLVSKTIETLSQVGTVLGESGKALSDARLMLAESANNIGHQTISDLNESSRRIVSSGKTLSVSLISLEQSLSSQLHSTGNTVLGELQNTTNQMIDLLGDPKQPIPHVSVASDTCKMEIDPSEDQKLSSTHSVLGVIANLAARLDAYANVSDSCKENIRLEINSLLGPINPTENECKTDSVSLTCNIRHGAETFDAAIKSNLADSMRAVSVISADPTASAVTKMEQLTADIELLKQREAELSVSLKSDTIDSATQSLQNSLNSIKNSLSVVKNQISIVEQTLNTEANDNASQENQIQALKKTICIESGQTIESATGTVKNPASISQTVAESMLRILSETRCPSIDTATDGARYITTASSSIEGYASKQKTAVEDLQKLLGVNGESLSVKENLEKITTSLNSAQQNLDSLQQAHGTNSADVWMHISALNNSITAISTLEADVAKQVVDINNRREGLKADLEQILSAGSAGLDQANKTQMDQSVNAINGTREDVISMNSGMIDGLSSDLRRTAQKVYGDGLAAVNGVAGGIKRLNDGLGSTTIDKLSKSSQVMSGMLGDAVRDSDGAYQLLSQDILRVLADIGTNASNGGGLLGVIAASDGQLGVTDVKLSTSTSAMSSFENLQRAQLDQYFMRQAQLRAALARLENQNSGAQSQQHSVSKGIYSFEIGSDGSK
ncbi:hypothetical protein [Arcanobacterium bovis]|uniref:Uncharacterized protein n=1 Tax=Arcanobacterium bovis TaxID=2529275 RepID=A0A4Q9V1E2_9ACTO|nr:hypothetical protein [Arcanobacterium bovis]TBW22863.1 hypothetical protein EZJ44_02910 [Arcanobacterium bovis]